MRALTWQGLRDVRVEDVPDPRIEEPTDAVVKVTSTALCGSDLHLYEVLGPYLSPGDVLGHETMGVVEEVGSEVTGLAPGDRVVVPFNIACGRCWMCERGNHAACETTQNRDWGTGAAMFGYTELYGAIPGGQAEYLRVPQAHFGPVKIPDEGPDERFLYLSDVVPTAWQAVSYAEVEDGDTLAVFGLGPIGQLACRIAQMRGIRAIGVDRVPERLALAAQWGAETVDLDEVDPVAAVKDLTGGRGADGTIDAVGMEAHGSPVASAMVKGMVRMPDAVTKPMMRRAGIDRLAALHAAIGAVRRVGTVSVAGVYGGMTDPMPMMEMFDRGISMRMGQCHVRRWTDEILEVLTRDDDVLGLEAFATHRLPLEEAPRAYEMFQKKQDGCIKVVFKP